MCIRDSSHDRAFLSRTTDRLIEVHADATMSDVPGGIDAWIARATGTTARARDARDSASSPTVPKGRAIRDAEKEMSRLERRKATLTEKLLASSGQEELTRLGSELATTQRDLSLSLIHI